VYSESPEHWARDGFVAPGFAGTTPRFPGIFLRKKCRVRPIKGGGTHHAATEQRRVPRRNPRPGG
jgi:hypothetical protein